TFTNDQGAFSISAQAGNTLVFTLIGYNPQEVAVTSQTALSVKMIPATSDLDEVVVIGYGTQQRRDITGAVSNVEAEGLKDVPVGQFSQKLQGRIAGVQISQTTGRPGQGMAIRIRGAASMNAGNTPLYVVDGQPVTGDINNINPDEIESFSVLKDASATALYGSRAANGVVLITTKKGKGEGVSIDFSTYVGAQYLPQRGRPDVMNA